MKLMKRLLMSVLCVSMCFVSLNTVQACSLRKDEKALIQDLLSYYAAYTKGDYNESNGWSATSFEAKPDVKRCLDALEDKNPALGKAYQKIMDAWQTIDTTMAINTDVLPDGLPKNKHLYIVVLGYRLHPLTGRMQKELIQRLQVALNSANKYPRAKIIVSGGNTSLLHPKQTEAKQMAAWLIDHGVDDKRILIEDRSRTTIENASRTFALLKDKKNASIALITSSSHVQRATLIFETVFQLEAYKQHLSSIPILSNASCYVTRKESFEQQVQAVKQASDRCLYTYLFLDAKIKTTIKNDASF